MKSTVEILPFSSFNWYFKRKFSNILFSRLMLPFYLVSISLFIKAFWNNIFHRVETVSHSLADTSLGGSCSWNIASRLLNQQIKHFKTSHNFGPSPAAVSMFLVRLTLWRTGMRTAPSRRKLWCGVSLFCLFCFSLSH